MNHAPYRETLEAAALNLLERAEQRLLDEHIAVCHSCKTILAVYQGIVASLAFTVEPAAPPPHLRARLQDRVMQLRMAEWFKL